MRGEKQRVRSQRGEINRQAPGRLHGVANKEPALRMHTRGRLGDRLNYAGFVVRGLHGEQKARIGRARREIGQGRIQRGKVKPARRVQREDRHIVVAEAMTVQHAGMLAGGDQKMRLIAAIAITAQAGMQQRGRRFRPAADRDEVAGIASGKSRDLAACGIERRTGRPALRMHGRRIARDPKCARDSLGDLTPYGCAGIVVEIGAPLRHGSRVSSVTLADDNRVTPG